MWIWVWTPCLLVACSCAPTPVAEGKTTSADKNSLLNDIIPRTDISAQITAPLLKKLNDALKVALKDPEFIKKQEGLGAVVVTDKRVEPAEHKKFVQAEVARFGPVIKAAGVYAD